MSEFSEKLKELRKSKNAMQKDMAKLIDVTVRNYQRYEAGEVDPPTSKTEILADYFNVPVDYLLGKGLFGQSKQIEKFMPEIIKVTKEWFGNYFYEDFYEWFAQVDKISQIKILQTMYARIEFEIINNENTITFYPLLPKAQPDEQPRIRIKSPSE